MLKGAIIIVWLNMLHKKVPGGDRMRVGITEDDANNAVSSLAKWAAWLVSVIAALRSFLASIGLIEEELPEKKAE